MNLIFILTTLLIFNHSLASSDDHNGHHDESSEKAGLNKAVLEFSESEGMKLSPSTIKSFPINIEMIKQMGKNQYLVPRSSINITLNKYSVFRLKEGYYKPINIEVIKQKDDQYLIKSIELKKGDEIAISNVSLLNITHVFLEDNSEYGHGH